MYKIEFNKREWSVFTVYKKYISRCWEKQTGNVWNLIGSDCRLAAWTDSLNNPACYTYNTPWRLEAQKYIICIIKNFKKPTQFCNYLFNIFLKYIYQYQNKNYVKPKSNKTVPTNIILSEIVIIVVFYFLSILVNPLVWWIPIYPGLWRSCSTCKLCHFSQCHPRRADHTVLR